MTTVRDARRALARGQTDEALVDLWNALEPLRLDDDRGGLKAVGQMAAQIAAQGDSSQVREAERLLVQVRALLQHDAAAEAVTVGDAGREVAVLAEAAPYDGAYESTEDGDYEGESEAEYDEPPEDDDVRPRLGKLVWALIVAAFVIFNIVSGLLRE